jgi:hypothetical protein
VGGKVFNDADEEVTSWEVLWGDVCGYFGLKGVGPRLEDQSEPRG